MLKKSLKIYKPKRISLININLKKCKIPNIDIKCDKEINQNKFNN